MAADGEAGFEDAANYVPDTDNPHASLLEGNKTPEAVVNAFWLGKYSKYSQQSAIPRQGNRQLVGLVGGRRKTDRQT